MATIELTKKNQPKAKRRSMPANLGHRTSLINEEEQADSSTSIQTSTIEESDHHILDLLLSESFNEAELGLDQPLTPTTYIPEGKNLSSNYDIETNNQSREVINDLQDLEKSLMSSPEKEEINNVLISQDVIESLTSVKHVALIALDSLLRQIVADHNSNIMASEIRSSRKRSSSFSHSPSQNANLELENIPKEERNSWVRSQLLADIAHNATKLSTSNEMLQTDSRLQYSPDIATLDIIRHQLDSSNSVILSDDYSLACTLAALLGCLYRILELCDSKKNPDLNLPSKSSELPNTTVQTSEEILQPVSNEDIYNTLHKEVTTLQCRRASLNLYNNVTDERLATWNEIDRLMEIVAGLCRERSHSDPPPKYSYNITGGVDEAVIDPPKYPLISEKNLSIKIDNEKTKLDLDNVIAAIDRVYSVAPQLNNQRVELSTRQKKRLTAVTLSGVIRRLSRGRFDGQQTDSSSVVKYQTLNRLIDQINKAAERSFVDQRVELSPRQMRQHEVAKLNGILERLEKNRMTNQDWHSPEQLLIQDLTRLTNELTETNTIYASQRYNLSPSQEREMFMNSIFKKVEKMQSYRMEDQDAESPTERKERAWKEIENLIVTKQQYSPSMNYQRATLSPKKTNLLRQNS